MYYGDDFCQICRCHGFLSASCVTYCDTWLFWMEKFKAKEFVLPFFWTPLNSQWTVAQQEGLSLGPTIHRGPPNSTPRCEFFHFWRRPVISYSCRVFKLKLAKIILSTALASLTFTLCDAITYDEYCIIDTMVDDVTVQTNCVCIRC